MAVEKNITMRQFNGVDYDTLYPKTIASQVDGVYNKEETLSDGTKTAYGLGASATPDDVFAVMSNDVSHVGDIKSTVRTDLGDKWLLCNGDSVDKASYPALFDVLPPSVPTNFSGKEISTTANYTVGLMKHVNGYYICSAGNGFYYISDTDLNGEWTYVSTPYSSNLQNFEYANGYYFYIGYNSDDSYLYKVYSSTIGGPYTAVQFNNSYGCSNGDAIYDSFYNKILYSYSIWGSGSNYGRIAYSTSIIEDPIFSTPTDKTTTSRGMIVSGGGRVVFGSLYDLSKIWITSDLTNWTTLSNSAILSGGCYDSETDSFYCVGVSSNETQSVYLYVIQSDGTMTTHNLGSCDFYYPQKKIEVKKIGNVITFVGTFFSKKRTSSAYDYIECVGFGTIDLRDNSFVSNAVYYESETKYNLESLASTIADSSVAVMHGTKASKDSSVYSTSFYTAPYIKLPTISYDGAYAYIKAKE